MKTREPISTSLEPSPGAAGLTDEAPMPDGAVSTYEARRGRHGVLREYYRKHLAPPATFYEDVMSEVRGDAGPTLAPGRTAEEEAEWTP